MLAADRDVGNRYLNSEAVRQAVVLAPESAVGKVKERLAILSTAASLTVAMHFHSLRYRR